MTERYLPDLRPRLLTKSAEPEGFHTLREVIFRRLAHLVPELDKPELETKPAVAFDPFWQVKGLAAPEVEDDGLCNSSLNKRHPNLFARLVFLIVPMGLVGADT